MEYSDQVVPVGPDSQDQDVQTEDHPRGHDNLRNLFERLKGDRGVYDILYNQILREQEKDVLQKGVHHHHRGKGSSYGS
jgi:hypothetical protein